MTVRRPETREVCEIEATIDNRFPAHANSQRESSAQAPEHFPRRAQRRRDAPTGRMFDIVNVLAQFFMPRASRSAIRICKKSNGVIDIKTRTQKLGKALSRVHCDIVEPVQLIDDHHLDQLIEGEWLARGMVIARSIGLVDQVAAE